MAGILPVAFNNGRIYFLYGRETVDVKWKDSGKWSDFGGSIEKGETLKSTAIREGYEETAGILGDEKAIRNLVDKNLIIKLTVNKFTTYIVEIPYDKYLPKKYRKTYLDTKKNNLDLITNKNGLWEKDKMKWVEYKELLRFRNVCRPWYKYVVTATHNFFKDFNKME